MTFATILAGLYSTAFILFMVSLFISFMNLTPRQQLAAKINISIWFSLGFLVAVSFLIARVLN